MTRFNTPQFGNRPHKTDAHKDWSDGVDTFAQALILRAAARRETMAPAEYAEKVGAPNRVVEFLKSDAAALHGAQSIGNASFLDYLRNSSVLDAMSKFMIPTRPREVFSIASTAYTANETGEAVAKPVQTKVFSESTVSPLKSTAIVVCSKEFLMQPISNITGYISRALKNAVSNQMNTSFFSGLDTAAVPSGQGSPTGTMAETLADIRELAKMVSYGQESRLYLIVSPDQAVWLTSCAVSVGNSDMTPQGGKFFGMTVLVSDALPASTVWCIDAVGLAFWDGGLKQSIAEHASVEMSTTPAGNAATPTTGNTNLVSLWQDNSTGFKVERSFAFKMVRPNSVAYLTAVTWGQDDSPIGSGV